MSSIPQYCIKPEDRWSIFIYFIFKQNYNKIRDINNNMLFTYCYVSGQMHYPIIATRSFPSISNDWFTTKSIILLFCGNFRKQGLHPSRRLAAVFRYTRRTGCGSVCTWSDVPFTNRRARAALHQLRHDIRGMCWTAQTQVHGRIQTN